MLRRCGGGRRRVVGGLLRPAGWRGRAVVVIVGGEVFEAVDDLFEVAEHDSVVVDETVASVGLGGVDEPLGFFCLAAVGGQELDGGLEIGAGETGVGVRAVLLGRPSAEAVGQAGGDAGEVVFDPLGV